MIWTIFGSNLPKVFSNVFDFFREGKNINNIQKWQAPPMVVDAEVYEKFYSLLILIVNIVTMKYPMRTLFCSERLQILMKQAIMLHHLFLLYMEQKKPGISQLTPWIVITFWWKIQFWILFGYGYQHPTIHKRCGSTQVYSATETNKKNCFFDKETQLVRRKSEHSTKPICLSRKCIIDVFK